MSEIVRLGRMPAWTILAIRLLEQPGFCDFIDCRCALIQYAREIDNQKSGSISISACEKQDVRIRKLIFKEGLNRARVELKFVVGKRYK